MLWGLVVAMMGFLLHAVHTARVPALEEGLEEGRLSSRQSRLACSQHSSGGLAPPKVVLRIASPNTERLQVGTKTSLSDAAASSVGFSLWKGSLFCSYMFRGLTRQ